MPRTDPTIHVTRFTVIREPDGSRTVKDNQTNKYVANFGGRNAAARAWADARKRNREARR